MQSSGGLPALLRWLNEDVAPPSSQKKEKERKEKTAPPPPPIVYSKSPQLLQNRSPGEKLLVLTAGVAFNVLLSFLLYLLYRSPLGLPTALPLALDDVGRTGSLIVRSLAAAAGGGGGGGGGTGIGGLSGPVGVLALGSASIARSGLPVVLTFSSFLSLNLAVINSLPLPGLDGGQVLWVLVEAVGGVQVEERVKEDVNALAVLGLAGVMVTTVVGDLQSLIG